MNLSFPPRAGGGLHDWILAYTRQEILAGRSKLEVRDRCWALTKDCGRRHSILAKEIEDSINGVDLSYASQGSTETGYLRSSWEYRDRVGNEGIRRPPRAAHWQMPLDQKLVERILDRRMLGKLSPRESFDLTELYASYNFPLCIAKEVFTPKARRLDYWRNYCDLRSMQWMVPNPCLECGDGGYVKKDLNAGERLWLIIEFDSLRLEEQAKLLFWLDRAHAEWDLAMIVYSGGKSLHGWFSCVGKLEHREIVRFFRVATSLGCDRMMRSSVQYTRVPLGLNAKTARQQRIMHWNNDAVEMHNEALVRRLEH